MLGCTKGTGYSVARSMHDGPVDATVSINQQSIPVEGAWVAFGPPKFAPDLIGWRSMYEVLEHLFIENGMMDEPAEVSFTRHVYPILQRMTALQWVNAGFAAMFGGVGGNIVSAPNV